MKNNSKEYILIHCKNGDDKYLKKEKLKKFYDFLDKFSHLKGLVFYTNQVDQTKDL